jgi:hypothetical protein
MLQTHSGLNPYCLSINLCHGVGYGSSSSCIPRNPAVCVHRHWKRGLRTKILGFNRADDGSLATAQIWIRVAADCVRKPERNLCLNAEFTSRQAWTEAAAGRARRGTLESLSGRSALETLCQVGGRWHHSRRLERRPGGRKTWLGLSDETPREAKSQTGVDLRRAWWTGLDAMVQYDSHGLAARRRTRCNVLIEHKRRSYTASRLQPPVRRQRTQTSEAVSACCRVMKNLQLTGRALDGAEVQVHLPWWTA